MINNYTNNINLLHVVHFQMTCRLVLVQEFLTPEKCAQHIIVRGLVRVLMVTEARRVLFFLTKKGFVNHGILGDVPKILTMPKAAKVCFKKFNFITGYNVHACTLHVHVLGGELRLSDKKRQGCLSPCLGVQMMDFGLTWGV